MARCKWCPVALKCESACKAAYNGPHPGLTALCSTKTATYSIASQYGYFTENGLNVVYNQVPNSTAALASVLSGQYDVLTATVDNALNYRFNQNKPVTVLGQLDQGPGLVVASVPSITSVSQLKGKPIIVDSPVSGYAYLLRATLLKYGLNLANGDYYFMVSAS
jgi:ABC-type nitrate/sulfonate/bicarbonate transport system substrate-binding protein